MNRSTEDSFPTQPARQSRPGSAETRGRYLVSWSAGCEREYSTFVEALTEYIERLGDRFGVQIHNLNRMVDGGDSGLTEIEKLAVEAADEAFCIEVA